MSALEQDILVTYRMPDGSLVYGEYGFVTDPMYFEECPESVTVVRETWRKVRSDTITFNEDES